MFSVLFRKELRGMLSHLLTNPRTGRFYGATGIAVACVLAAFILVGVSTQFYAYADMLAVPMAAAGVRWLYYALLGIVALAVGTVGGVMTSYSALYRAKDNEFLLSLPIPPSAILLSRAAAVYGISLLFTAVAWLPAVLRYWQLRTLSFAEIVFPILLLPFIAAAAAAVSCLIGWLVALAAGVIRHKTAAVILLTTGLVALYLYGTVRLFGVFRTILLRPETAARFVQTRLHLFRWLGGAATGDPLCLLAFLLAAAAASALCLFVLSRTFVRILTSQRGVRGAVYRERRSRASGVRAALFRREVKHYFSSPTWLMNSIPGVVFMVAGAVAAVLYRGQVRLFLEKAVEVSPSVREMIPAAGAAFVCLLVSMDFVTAAAVSLEGKELWLVRSFPCRAWDVLRAKERLGLAVNLLPAAVSAGVLGFAAGFGPAEIALMTVTAAVYAWFSADFGLFLNLMSPNLSWTNEAIPVKQSAPAFFAMFGGGLTALAVLAGSYALRNVLTATRYLLLCSALFLLLTVILRLWLRRRGTEIFDSLQE